MFRFRVYFQIGDLDPAYEEILSQIHRGKKSYPKLMILKYTKKNIIAKEENIWTLICFILFSVFGYKSGSQFFRDHDLCPYFGIRIRPDLNPPWSGSNTLNFPGGGGWTALETVSAQVCWFRIRVFTGLSLARSCYTGLPLADSICTRPT